MLPWSAIQTMDDLGVWCNYGQLHRDFKKMYVKGLWKKVLPEKEYNSIPWQKIEDCDASFLQDLFQRIAYRQGEMGKWLGESTPYMLGHFGIQESDCPTTDRRITGASVIRNITPTKTTVRSASSSTASTTVTRCATAP